MVLFLAVGASTSPIFAQQIMSFEEYQQLDHDEPYILHLTTNRGSLLYFGSRHSFNPRDPQMDSLANRFQRFSPDVIFTEGFVEDVDSLDRAEVIKRFGESGFTWKLASRYDIPVESLEPDRADEVRYLKNQGWSDTQIILFYTLRQVAQSHEKQASIDLNTVLPRYLNSLKQRFGLDGPITFEEFETQVYKSLPSVSEWEEIPMSYFYPGPQDPEYFTNRIATDSNIFRDRHHIHLISEAVRSGKKVFAIAGSAHVVMQEPALREKLTKGKGE